MGSQVPMYGHARSSLGCVYTQKETEAWRWGSPAAFAQSTPMAPQALHSAVPGCAGGTRWAGGAEEGTFLPCADRPRRAPAAPGPAPLLPFLAAILAGDGPVLAQVEP